MVIAKGKCFMDLDWIWIWIRLQNDRLNCIQQKKRQIKYAVIIYGKDYPGIPEQSFHKL